MCIIAARCCPPLSTTLLTAPNKCFTTVRYVSSIYGYGAGAWQARGLLDLDMIGCDQPLFSTDLVSVSVSRSLSHFWDDNFCKGGWFGFALELKLIGLISLLGKN